ncbi:MAG: hypothetical protein GF398_07615 [Chitinivibrionales bacterium]|nr:hypothetical protein [Chitinivibrionales bacterium]
MRKSFRFELMAIKLCVCALALAPTLLFAGKAIIVPSSEAQTIALAFIKARAGDTVLVENGIYRENIFVEAGVILKARHKQKAILDGKGKGTVVTLGRNSAVDGFVIRNGTIGVFSKNANNSIINCRIENNWQTGIICVRHLPRIEDNLLVFNRASGIQGWDVRSTGDAIKHNTIAFNENHGVAIGGKSSVIIENNIIAFNERFPYKILPEAEKVKMTNNNFYQNLWQPTALPSGNFSYDPKFAAPRSGMNFKSRGNLACPECPKDQIPGVRTQ